MNCGNVINLVFLLSLLVLCYLLVTGVTEHMRSQQMKDYLGQFDKEGCDRAYKGLFDNKYNIGRMVTIFMATKYKGESVNSNTFLGRGCAHMMRNCEITDSAHMAGQADVVVFHNSDFNSETFTRMSRLNLPKNVPKIWFNLDAPSNETEFIENVTFNWTLSYRNDSDFLFPFGVVKDLEKIIRESKTDIERDNAKRACYPKQDDEHEWEKLKTVLRYFLRQRRNDDESWQKPKDCNNSTQLNEIEKKLNANGLTLDVIGECGSKFYNCAGKPTIDEKYKCVDEWIKPLMLESLSHKSITAAFLSPYNCTTESQSMQLVKKMIAEGLQVDILGNCGSRPCSNGTYTENSNCMKQLIKPYKFFFAFEEEVCSDVVTEDFYSSLRNWNAVPIVLKREIYENLKIPPNLFIAMDDYNTTAELVDHINNLNTNKTAYEDLHRWREDYWVGILNNEFSGFCDLCRRIFLLTQPPSNNRNIKEWYLNKQCDRNFTGRYL